MNEMVLDSIEKRIDIPALVKEDDPILHRPLKPFNFDGDIDAGHLADTLFESMKHYRGVGLSACQIGIDARVFVMGYDLTKGAGGVRYDIFNPKVLDITGKELMGYEGCISYPLMDVMIKRPGSILVSYQDKYGKFQQEMFAGLTARIFLHEYDHMEGITFKDRVSKFKWDLSCKKRDKLLKKVIRSRK